MPKAGLQIFHLQDYESMEVTPSALDVGCTLAIGNLRLTCPSLWHAEQLLDGGLKEIQVHKARIAERCGDDIPAYDRAIGLDLLPMVGF